MKRGYVICHSHLNPRVLGHNGRPKSDYRSPLYGGGSYFRAKLGREGLYLMFAAELNCAAAAQRAELAITVHRMTIKLRLSVSIVRIFSG